MSFNIRSKPTNEIYTNEKYTNEIYTDEMHTTEMYTYKKLIPDAY